jgi:mono/diheme cytochrome c family protein
VKLSEQIPKLLVVGILAGGVAIFVSKFTSSSTDSSVDVKVPELSVIASRGKMSFDANCAQCHGENAAGSEQGPPLVHKIYNPGHHSDGAFLIARQRGVPRHHWNFGNMPSQPQISEAVMKDITRYVRELQIANGIKYQPHNM